MSHKDLEKRKQYHKEYYQKNKEQVDEKAREWRENNVDRFKKKQKEWQINNPYQSWAGSSNRGHKRKGNIIRITNNELANMGKEASRCSYCNCELDYSRYTGRKPNSATVDRINNGNIIDGNTIQIICKKCNTTKLNRTHTEFIQYCKEVVAKFAIVFLVGIFIFSSCVTYHPSQFPSYDVLNPSAEVRLNPIEFTKDGNVIVNEAFMLWVYELKEEIKRLRKLVK